VSAFLVRQVGEKLARDLLLTGRLIDAHEAYSMGLVSRVTEEQSALEAALELARSLLKNSPASLRATKQLLKQQNGAQLDHDLGAAAEANAEMRKTNDFAEGLSAFLEKRKPVWSVNSKD
jgi:methylglutaconyl-CoA hydratase